MTTFDIYYSQPGCMNFMPTSVNLMAVNEQSAEQVFYIDHPRGLYQVTTVIPEGIYNNNGRYSKYFKNTI